MVVSLSLASQPRWRLGSLLTLLLITILYLFRPTSEHTQGWTKLGHPPPTVDLAQHFITHPLKAPYKNVFGEMGRRCRLLRDWLTEADQLRKSTAKAALLDAAERTAASHFPFLLNATATTRVRMPLTDLRASFSPGTSGIVIPCGYQAVRFAAQLILGLRTVLNTDLPIQVAYGGDKDLPWERRGELLSLLGDAAIGLEFLDVLSVFNDETLELGEGGWAIKPFAALGSRFENVILVDADAVFLQDPRVLLSHPAFLADGALLFHDRLSWQHEFMDRQRWYHEQIWKPSAMLNKSRMWTEEYAEEGDSGVVVVNKSRIDVLVGMLHTAWQNTYEVRENITYHITHGDKETWWLGLELAGSRYQFEQHYFFHVGWEETNSEGKQQVCSSTVAHLDAEDRVLWYNGGLLKNKNLTNEYALPDKWMVDAEWRQPSDSLQGSCMAGGRMNSLTDQEAGILNASIQIAKEVDKMLGINVE